VKKIYSIVVFILLTIPVSNAQSRLEFGISGGYFLGSLSGSLTGYALDITDGSGVYLGLFAGLKIIDKFYVRPELFYANIRGENSIVLPVMARYYLTNKFSFQVGPQLDVLLDIPDNFKDFVKEFGTSIAIGAGFDITKKIGIQAKYTFGLTDRVDLPQIILGDIISENNVVVKTNSLQLGLTYKF